MALDKFYFKVKKLDVMPDEFVAQNTERYGNNTKIIYGAYAIAHAEKNNIDIQQLVSIPVIFNQENSFVSWEDLKETDVVSWIEATIDVEELQQKMEERIDQQNSLQTQTDLPWSN
jgi:hypothetical protein